MSSNRYSPELRERAIRMVREHRGEYKSERETLLSIAPKLAVPTILCGPGCASTSGMPVQVMAV